MKKAYKIGCYIGGILIGLLISVYLSKSNINLWRIEVPDTLMLNAGEYVYQSEVFALPHGHYVVVVDYESDQDNEICELYAVSAMNEDGEKGRILARKEMPASEKSARIEFHTDNDIAEFQIRILYQGGSFALKEIAIRDVENFTDGIVLYILGVLGITATCLVFKYGTKKQRICFATISMVTLLATMPYFSDFLIRGHDLEFHLNRIEGIYQAVKTGDIMARINPIQNLDYGYASGIMYPQLFLYFPVLLRMLGVSLLNSYKIFIFIINLVTAVIAYISFKNILKRVEIGLLGSICYTLCSYRLINIYTRASIGEILAMVFLPLILWGFWECIWGDYRKWYVLMLGFCGLIQSHLLSVIIYCIMGVLLCILGVKKLWNEKIRITYIGIAALGTVLLNLWTIIPILDYLRENFNVFSGEGVWVQDWTLYFSQLFNTYLINIQSSTKAPGTTKNEMLQSIGMLGLLGISGYVLLEIVYKERMDKESEVKRLRVFGRMALGIIIVFAFMSSWLMPWNLIRRSELVYGILSKIEFPWRFLAVVSVFVVVLWGINVIVLDKVEKKGMLAMVVCIVSCIITALPIIDATTQMTTYSGVGEVIYVSTLDVEYLYKKSDYSDIEKRGQVITFSQGSQLSVERYTKRGNKAELLLNGATREGDFLELPIYYYPDYHAVLDGEEVEIQRGTAGTIKIILPQLNDQNRILEISFKEKPTWIIADIISVIIIVVAIGYVIYNNYYKKRSMESDNKHIRISGTT